MRYIRTSFIFNPTNMETKDYKYISDDDADFIDVRSYGLVRQIK